MEMTSAEYQVHSEYKANLMKLERPLEALDRLIDSISLIADNDDLASSRTGAAICYLCDRMADNCKEIRHSIERKAD